MCGIRFLGVHDGTMIAGRSYRGALRNAGAVDGARLRLPGHADTLDLRRLHDQRALARRRLSGPPS
jgi:hypothetical protein